jgi:hypothetical protein
MRESAISEKVNQKLSEFENIVNIQPSAEWNNTLMNRFDSAKRGSNSSQIFTGLMIPIIFVVLINIGFIMNTVIKNSHQPSTKDQEFRLISEELLINPVSIKN